MQTLSDPAFKSTQEVQSFVLLIFMLLSPPMPFALMPFLAQAFLNVLHGYRGAIGMLPEFAKSRLEYFFTDEGSFQVCGPLLRALCVRARATRARQCPPDHTTKRW